MECSDSGIRLTVWADGQAVILGMADPSRVRVRHSGEGPFEFVCGRQEGQKVAVEYAATATGTVAGVLRGIRFLP